MDTPTPTLRDLIVEEVYGPPYPGKGPYAHLERRADEARRKRLADAIDRALVRHAALEAVQS